MVEMHTMGMGGIDQLDQTRRPCGQSWKQKWLWSVFRFFLNFAVNNAFQIFKSQEHSSHFSYRYFLGFRKSVVDTYYKRYRTKNIIQNTFPAARSSDDKRVQQDVRSDNFGH